MDLFEFVKSQIDILALAKEHTSLKRAGIYWKGRCPFHNEKTGSFTISPHKGIFYCFGCHANGDAIGFVAKTEHCSQFEAVKLLIEKFNLVVPEQLQLHGSATTDHAQAQKQHFKTCEIVASWCQKNLTKTTPAYNYLINTRMLSTETIDRFKIGYFKGGPAGVKELISFANKYQILTADLVKAGVIGQSKTGSYSPFEERIIFPITDYLGRYCGFGGRIFKAQDQRAKYYNSRESEYFNKGALLFGLATARPAIQQQDAAILVEGYTDCVSLVQHGYANTVAVLGTACTSEHIKLIARFASQIYLLYDSDPAGQQAILRLAELCWDFNIEVQVLSLPTGEDPASYLSAGHDLTNVFAAAQDIYQFMVASSCQTLNQQNLAGKMAGISKLLQTITRIPDELKRSLLLESAAKSLGIPLETLLKASAQQQPKAKSQYARLSTASAKIQPANQPTSQTPSFTTVAKLTSALDGRAAHAPNTQSANLAARPTNDRNYGQQLTSAADMAADNSATDNLITANQPDQLQPYQNIDTIEKKIFAAIISTPELFTPKYQPLTTQLSEPFRKILAKLATQHSFNQIMSSLSDPEQTFINQTLLSESILLGANEFQQLVLLFLQKRWKAIIDQTKQQVSQAQAQLDTTALTKTMTEFQQLKTALLEEIK